MLPCFSLYKLYGSVMGEMDDMMAGKFSKETDSERHDKFQGNMKKFHAAVRQVVDEHQEKRYVIILTELI